MAVSEASEEYRGKMEHFRKLSRAMHDVKHAYNAEATSKKYGGYDVCMYMYVHLRKKFLATKGLSMNEASPHQTRTLEWQAECTVKHCNAKLFHRV